MSENTICGEIKGHCIPGAKEEFLRFSLTQHFRSNHHFDKRGFFYWGCSLWLNVLQFGF